MYPDDPSEVFTVIPMINTDVFALRNLMISKVPVRRFIMGRR